MQLDREENNPVHDSIFEFVLSSRVLSLGIMHVALRVLL